jgi:hypothetical protein
MKKFIFYPIFIVSIIAISLSIALPSCQKYQDGPAISLRSRTERLANTWTVENYKVNGTDLTSLVTNYTETFSKTGNYSYNWGNSNNTGNWNFQNNDAEIKLNGNDDQTSRTCTILKLEENTLWYFYMDGNDRHDLHLVSN